MRIILIPHKYCTVLLTCCRHSTSLLAVALSRRFKKLHHFPVGPCNIVGSLHSGKAWTWLQTQLPLPYVDSRSAFALAASSNAQGNSMYFVPIKDQKAHMRSIDFCKGLFLPSFCLAVVNLTSNLVICDVSLYVVISKLTQGAWAI